jgi:hypothetical protein
MKDIDKALELTDAQQKAFNKFMKAYKECEKLNVLFVNNYGMIIGFDHKKVEKYTDPQTDNIDNDYVFSTYQHDVETIKNSFTTSLCSWADDEHVIVLTEYGKKIVDDDN